MAKRYKCPYCELRDERKKLIAHIDKRHEEMLPEGYDGARTVYDMINHTNGHGTCRVCKKDTQWNMSSQRYDVLCGNPKCKEAMREEYKKNMLRVKGTYNILNDPEQQQKMLANRKISGKYRYSDGTIFTYTGSYEKKLLEFEDAVMNIPSKDIMMPGPTIEYMYNGKKHFYIADQLYIPYNLIIEIKDGGDNKNGKETPGMIASREKTIEKEKVITDKGEYNYLRLTNNDFVQLIEIFMELKENYMNGNDSKVVRVHESYINPSYSENSIIESKSLEFTESLETRLTTNIFEKEITIYHGSPTKTSIIYPLSFNAGTKLSKPRMSSFWADEHTAKLFGIYRLVQDNNFIISFTPDLRGLLVKPSDYNNIIRLLKSENIYLYEKTLDKKYVGIGHSNYFDEYTVDYPVRPDKIYVLGYNDLKAEISSIDTYNTNDNEKIYKITEKNLNIMLKMNNGIMRKIIANDFQYFRDKSKEYRKGQLATANNESAIDPKVVEIANYINENFIFNEDYFNVKMEPINNNTYLIAEYIIGKNSLDMKELSDSFSILKERCNTDQYGLCMIKESNNNKYNLYLTDISAFKESVLKGPKKCPKCGGKVGVFIEGEPIYKCIECGKFLGVVSCHLGKKKK